MNARTALAVGLLAVMVLPPSPVRAQEGDLLAAAEDAYLNVDFEQTYALAERAVSTGGRSVRHLARLYELMGLAAAAQGEEAASRDAYMKMLALRPDAEVDRNLAPRLRSPFMEARGFWASRSERLGADVRLDRVRGGVRVSLTDPLNMARGVVVHTRLGRLGAFTSVRRDAEESLMVQIDGFDDEATVEYYVHVLDEHDNRIIEVGSEADPQMSRVDAATGGGSQPEEPPGDSILRKPWFWAVVGAVLVGGGLTMFFVLRDDSVSFRPTATFQ